MKLFYIFCFCFCFCFSLLTDVQASPVLAAEQVTSPATPAPAAGSEVTSEEQQVKPTKEPSTESFVPTEKVDADASVPFPVDI